MANGVGVVAAGGDGAIGYATVRPVEVELEISDILVVRREAGLRLCCRAVRRLMA
jgi:hypothetical protein